MPDETNMEAQEVPATAPTEVAADIPASEPAPAETSATPETAPAEAETPATQETPEVTPEVEQDGGEPRGYQIQQ